jgi:hypothetical protein
MRKLAFFIGSDITSNLLTFDVVNRLGKQYECNIFFVQPLSDKVTNIKELRELMFFERTLLNDIVYPFLDSAPYQKGASYTSPLHFKNIYKINLEYIDNINGRDFIKRLDKKNITGGISIRCYQKFGLEIINRFSKNNKFIWNLHPGLLPKYRGVMTCIRALSNNEMSHTYTLHKINSEWDAGPILDISPIPLDRKSSVLTNMINLYPSGIEIIQRNIDNFYNNISLGAVDSGITQNEQIAGYYSFPAISDFQEYNSRNIKCVDKDFMHEFYINKFTKAGTIIRDKLDKILNAVISNFYLNYC